MTETRELLEEIYQTIDLAEALAALAPRDKGAYYTLTCPICGAPGEAYIYKGGHRVYCNRKNKCGLSMSLWDYIQSSRGLSPQETLRELARLAGYELPDLDPEAVEKIEREKELASVWESSLDYFRAQLKEKKGLAVLDYLKGRGYSEKEIEAMELGLFTSTEELKATLVGKGYKEDLIAPVIQALENITKAHRLVIPYRDPVGRVKGFIIRAIKEGVEPKYLYNLGLKRDTPFNLDRARGHSKLIVVEGYLDALAIRERAGLENVIALGDASFSETKLDQALKYGARAFILALDNDKAGEDGTERALELLQKRDLRAYVLILPDGIKDPDELIKTSGANVFRTFCEAALSGAQWKGGRILRRYNGTDQARDQAIDEAIVYEDGLKDQIERKNFLDTVTRGLGLTPSLLEHRLLTYKEKRAQDELRRGYAELFTKGPELLRAGDMDGLKDYLDEKGRELRTKAVIRVLEPYRLENLQEDIAQTRPGLKTGYESLDSLFLIPPEAITIIGARPSHGKTTLLMNLLLNMTQAYPEQSFFFFSYEESRKQVGVKLLNILSGEVLDKTGNVRALEDCLRAGQTNKPNIERGRAKFRELTESKRLWIVDEPLFVDELADTLALLWGRYDIGAIFIDYIQKVKIKGRYATRQLEIQKISERILETAKGLSIPIILGAQLGRDKERADKVRLDNLREAGDIEQDANLVLGLYNPAMEKAQDEGERSYEDEIKLKVTVLKNRNGPVNEERTLVFNRPLLTIKDNVNPFRNS